MPCSPDENHVVSAQHCNISHNENAKRYSSPGIIRLEGRGARLQFFTLLKKELGSNKLQLAAPTKLENMITESENSKEKSKSEVSFFGVKPRRECWEEINFRFCQA